MLAHIPALLQLQQENQAKIVASCWGLTQHYPSIWGGVDVAGLLAGVVRLLCGAIALQPPCVALARTALRHNMSVLQANRQDAGTGVLCADRRISSENDHADSGIMSHSSCTSCSAASN